MKLLKIINVFLFVVYFNIFPAESSKVFQPIKAQDVERVKQELQEEYRRTEASELIRNKLVRERDMIAEKILNIDLVSVNKMGLELHNQYYNKYDNNIRCNIVLENLSSKIEEFEKMEFFEGFIAAKIVGLRKIRDHRPLYPPIAFHQISTKDLESLLSNYQDIIDAYSEPIKRFRRLFHAITTAYTLDEINKAALEVHQQCKGRYRRINYHVYDVANLIDKNYSLRLLASRILCSRFYKKSSNT